MAGVSKLALDFLPRPATMTPRQHSGTKLSIDGENPPGDGNTIAGLEGTGMAVWFMRWLQCTGAGTAGTPTNDRGDNVRTRERAHALNHEGAID
jgi:hypothetical protein